MTSSGGSGGAGVSINFDQKRPGIYTIQDKCKNVGVSLSIAQTSAWMERLRSKCASYKALSDLSKAVRTALLDRRQVGALDGEDKCILRKSLDTLSEAIPVRGATSMAERLEAIARKMGRHSESGQNKLSFMDAPAHGCFYLSTEMFYVEINVDSTSGKVNEAKIHHIDTANGQTASGSLSESAQQNCIEMIDCLNAGDFGRFVQHLEGLMIVYNLNGGQNISAPQKSVAWNALSLLERDLETHYNTYRNWTTGPANFIHNTPLGLLQPRTGGVSMQLRYFLPPYDLLKYNGNHDNQRSAGTRNLSAMNVLTLDEIVKQENICFSAAVGLEASPRPNLLPTGPLYGASKQHGCALDPLPLGPNNSVTLYVRYALKFDKSIPLSLSKLKQISSLTEMHHDILTADRNGQSQIQPMMELIVRNSTNEQLNPANNRGLFVTLPDQQHCYFLSDHPDLKGLLVSSIPFRHPSQIPEILEILRQQALFNTLIESCARVKSIQDLESSIMFEISATDIQSLTITFEVPAGLASSGAAGFEEAMASVQLDLSSNAEVKSSIFCTTNEICPENFLDKAIQRSLSIPIAMRSIIKFCQMKRVKQDSMIQQQQIELHHQQNSRDSTSSTKMGQIGQSSVDFKFSANQGLEVGQIMDIANGNSVEGGGVEHFMLQQNQFLLDSQGNSQQVPAPGLIGTADETFIPTGIKSEPMDYEQSNTIDSGNKSFSSTSSDPLNAFGPQDIAFHPGASVAETAGTAGMNNSNAIQTVVKKEQNLVDNPPMGKLGALTSTKVPLAVPHRLMEAHSSRNFIDATTSKNNSKKNVVTGAITNNNKRNKPQSLASGGSKLSKREGRSIKILSKVNPCLHNIKPSVSITPVTSSGDGVQGVSDSGMYSDTLTSPMCKKGNTSAPGGIEIIPLGHHHNSSHHSAIHHSSHHEGVIKSGSSSSKNPKDVPRRSLSENDSMSSSSNSKRKFSKSSGVGGTGGGSTSFNKKRRHVPDLEKMSSKLGDKKYTGSGGSPLKRPSYSLSASNNSGGKSSKLSSPTLSISKANTTGASPISAATLSSSSGGIEIIPAVAGAGQFVSSSTVKSHNSSYTGSISRDKSPGTISKPSSSSGLKVTIKNTSSSSGSKHRSDHHRGGGSSGIGTSGSIVAGSNKTKVGGNPSNSAYIGGNNSLTTQKQRSSPSMLSSLSQQKYSGTVGAVSLSKHSSSICQSSSSEKDRQKERERQQRCAAEKLEREKLCNERKAEEVRRILSGGKSLNTTFQIPKLSSTSIKSDDYVMMSSSTKAASGEINNSQGSKSANASPKYGVSPKYHGSIQQTSNISTSAVGTSRTIATSPKISSGSSPKLASVSPKGGTGGNFTLPNASGSSNTSSTLSASPRYIGGGSVTPPNISPKHSMTSPSSFTTNFAFGGNYGPGNSTNQASKSSPNYSSQSLSSSDPSNLYKKTSLASSQPNSKSTYVSGQGQSIMVNYKPTLPFSSGNSGRTDCTPVTSSSTSKHQTQPFIPTGSTAMHATLPKNQLDQTVLGSTTETLDSSINLGEQSNQSATLTGEYKKQGQQMSTTSRMLESIPGKGVNDSINKANVDQRSNSSNGNSINIKTTSLSAITESSDHELK